MIKKTVILLLAMIGLAACAPKVWVKPGATTQDFNVDKYSCEKDMRQSGYFGSGIAGAINMGEFFDECMVAHGWRVQSQQAAAAPQPPPVVAMQRPAPQPPTQASAATAASKPMFGVSVDSVAGPPAGLTVLEVLRGGVAERAGIQKGDVILKYAGRATFTPDDLQAAVDATKAGETAALQVWRQQKELAVLVSF